MIEIMSVAETIVDDVFLWLSNTESRIYESTTVTLINKNNNSSNNIPK